jgi:hypothetical protein
MSKYHFSIQEQGIIKQPLCPISNHLCKQKANYNTNRNTNRWNQAHIKVGFKLINDNKSTEASKAINFSLKKHTQKQEQ